MYTSLKPYLKLMAFALPASQTVFKKSFINLKLSIVMFKPNPGLWFECRSHMFLLGNIILSVRQAGLLDDESCYSD